MNPRFLRQKTSGYIYPWHRILAERDDMEPYEPEVQVKEPENTRENSVTTSPEPGDDLQKAREAFKRGVSKPGRKPSKPTGEA